MLFALLLFALLALLVGVFTAAKWVLIVALVLFIASALTGFGGRRSRF
jgi:general stress protein CsbA